MRDPNRIDYYCDELAELWHKVPDWRFGQLIWNIISYNQNYDKDTFYLEDANMFKMINEMILDYTTVRGTPRKETRART